MIIHKYTLAQIYEVQCLIMPKDAEILSIQMQNNSIQIWAKIDTNKPSRTYSFIIIGTGWDFESNLLTKHLATVQDDNLVWHIFGEE